MTQRIRAGYRMGRPTHWLVPNRLEGTCQWCGHPVLTGQGETRFTGAIWIVRHLKGTCHSKGYSQYVSLESKAWELVRKARLDFAGHRCEWRSLLFVRCKAVESLQCHHRHYHTLGAERLRDVIMLCAKHHQLADRRRRNRGVYPTIGHPLFGSNASIVTGEITPPPPLPPPPPPPE
jgi:hypothetical protein